MSAAQFEQETTVNFMRDEDFATIYTSDTTVMTRLDKLAKNKDCPDWEIIEEHYTKDHNLVAKTYKTKKRLISFRSSIIVREYTEEELQAMADRMREIQRKAAEKKRLSEEDIPDTKEEVSADGK